jgi:hypothetical protein
MFYKTWYFVAIQGCPVQVCEMVLRAKCNREEQHEDITRISRNGMRTTGRNHAPVHPQAWLQEARPKTAKRAYISLARGPQRPSVTHRTATVSAGTGNGQRLRDTHGFGSLCVRGRVCVAGSARLQREGAGRRTAVCGVPVPVCACAVQRLPCQFLEPPCVTQQEETPKCITDFKYFLNESNKTSLFFKFINILF